MFARVAFGDHLAAVLLDGLLDVPEASVIQAADRERAILGAEQLIQRSAQLASAALQHHDRVARLFHFLQVMRCHQDRGAALCTFAQDVEHDAGAERVQARGGFVQQQHLGVAEQRCRQREPFLHAGAVGAHQPTPGSAKFKPREQGLGAVVGNPVGQSEFAAIPLQELAARERAERQRPLGLIREPLAQRARARDFAEAIAIANDTPYGLTAGVYSRSPANLERARRDLDAGSVYLNRGITGALVSRQPFGGFKMSGVGSKAGGPEYLLQFCVAATVTENTMRRGFAPTRSTGDGRRQA